MNSFHGNGLEFQPGSMEGIATSSLHMITLSKSFFDYKSAYLVVWCFSGFYRKTLTRKKENENDLC